MINLSFVHSFIYSFIQTYIYWCSNLLFVTLPLQTQACMAVRNLVARTRDHNQPFILLGIEPLLREAEKLCPDEAKAALRDLDLKVELRELWKGEKTPMTSWGLVQRGGGGVDWTWFSLVGMYSQPCPSQILWGWRNSLDLDKFRLMRVKNKTIESKEKALCISPST